ncbi:type II toxin-antitoxin system VapC family toxin [Methylobacterium sp. 17Sr1-1]|uniref:type II toxin-antitoxin system VapC family toxin n=1 Tax=Methylobacterium sp. 17Sr1-1 TaxID=2202826 RepID=UPI000D6F27DF|nr:type II toxin-antitoxin system VapC family toxin [Methylobacterium sp. 17Sr1-1]AWN50892.1 VapC toxin family PIN domain ribonuclease [Methylobacterium sp. 17Sr1-1]
MSALRFLLDTNVVSDLVRNPSGSVARRISEIGSHGIATSIISVAELRYGCAKRGSTRLLQQVEAVLQGIEIVPFESPADAEYGRLRAELEAAGRLIGPNDLLIAAQGLALGVPVVTANEAEFRRVRGLIVENWL